jgi:hypothetical protein
MSNSIDFKALWNNGAKSDLPDATEIIKKAADMQRKTRNALLACNLLLAFTVVFITLIWVYYQPQMVTTKVGLMLIIGAIVFFLIVSMGFINLLYKDNTESSTNEYLDYLLKVKQKQEVLRSTVLTIYIAMLSVGLALYMIEYAGRGGVLFRVLAYGITFGWIAFNWFYMLPKITKKQREKINALISKLEELKGQMEEAPPAP